MMAFDVEGARKAGYTDAEIAEFLGNDSKFDVAGARKSGYSDGEIIAHLSSKPAPLADQVPGIDGGNTKTTSKPEPSLADKAIGTGEAALTAVTGATGGTLGMLGGAIGGVAGSVASGDFGTQKGVRAVEDAAAKGAEQLTYQPRTQSGQEQAGALGEAMQNLIPLAPMAGEAAAISKAAAPAKAAVVDTGIAAASKAKDVGASALERMRAASPAIAERVQRTLSRNPDAPTPGTMQSIGSAGTDMALQRRQAAESLPVPIELTKGQATRNSDQLRFEVETSKGNLGAALRERASETNARFQRNFDAFVDQTGAQAFEPIDVGRSVDAAIRNEAKRDKTAIRVAYAKADASAESTAPISLTGAVEFLNESAPDAAVSKLLVAARARAIKLGIAQEGPAGELVPVATTVKNAERFRRAIGEATDYEPTNIRNATMIKGLVDSETEAVAGPLYRDARRLRENYAKKYESRAIVSDLLNKKRGMADRKIALEDVLKESILNGTREDLSYLRRVLHGSDEGKQAWRDLQGATVNWLKDESLKNVATDQRGNRIVSAAQLDRAVKQLERGGKLEFVFGKKGAQTIRDLNDLAKVTMTTPPGAVNTSNTASVILAAMTEMGATGAITGLPVPVISSIRMLTRYAKDKQIQRRINDALTDPRATPEIKAPTQKKPNRTLH
jgi:hypothetical protein